MVSTVVPPGINRIRTICRLNFGGSISATLVDNLVRSVPCSFCVGTAKGNSKNVNILNNLPVVHDVCDVHVVLAALLLGSLGRCCTPL